MTTSFDDLHSEPTEYNPRIIADSATLRFDRGKGDARWIVASISPTAGTGEAQILGAAIDAATGKIIDPRTGREVKPELGFREVGSWTLVAALDGGACLERGTYDWNQPFDSPFRVSRIEIYDVFSDMNRGRQATGGGIIVTRYDGREEGRKPFCEVDLIPPSWHETVQSAFDAFNQDEPPFARTTSQDQALSLLDAESPLIALAAFRQLTQDIDANRKALQQGTLATGGYLRAARAYLALRAIRDEPTAVGFFQEMIGGVVTMQGLRPLVVAIATAGLFSDQRSVMRDIANYLLALGRERLDQIHDGSEIDPQLRRLLHR